LCAITNLYRFNNIFPKSGGRAAAPAEFSSRADQYTKTSPERKKILNSLPHREFGRKTIGPAKRRADE
jgi:rRNA maturation protein Nop10